MKRHIDQMWHLTKSCFDEMVFDQMLWIPVLGYLIYSANFVYFTRYGDKGITCTNVTEEAR